MMKTSTEPVHTQLHPLSRFHLEQRRWRLEGHSISRAVYCLECADGSGIQRELPFADVDALIATKQLLIEENVFAPDGTLARKGHPAEGLVSASPRDQVLALNNLAWAEEAAADHKAGRFVLYDRPDGRPTNDKGALTASAWIRSKVGVVADKLRQLTVLQSPEPPKGKRKNRRVVAIDPPGASSLKSLLATYKAPGFHIGQFVARWDRCDQGGLRIAREVEELILSTTETLYASEGRMNVSGLVQHIRAKVRTELGPKFRAPGRSTIERRLKALPHWRLIATRFGFKRMREKSGSTSKGPRFTKIGEMLYMDCHKVDVVVLLRKLGIWGALNRAERRFWGSRRRVWMCIAMDAASRLVVGIGFALSESPELTRRVLRVAMENRIDYDSAVAANAPGLPPVGWAALTTDSGVALTHPWFRVPALHLIPDVKVGIVGKPWRQGAKERLFRTTKDELLPYATGLTFGDPKAKGDYDAMERASIMLDQLGNMYWRYFRDVNALKGHRGLRGQPPINFAAEALEAMGAPDAASDELLHVAFGHDLRLPLTSKGLTYRGVCYQSSWLARLFADGGSKDLRVKLDPVNLGRIFVLHEKHWQLVPGPVELQGRGLTEWIAFTKTLQRKHGAQAEVNFSTVAKALLHFEKIGVEARLAAKLSDQSYHSDEVERAGHSLELRIIYRPLPTVVTSLSISAGAYGAGYDTADDLDEGVLLAEPHTPEETAADDVPEHEDDDQEAKDAARKKGAARRNKPGSKVVVRMGSLQDLKARRGGSK